MTADLLLVTAMLVGFALFGLAMLVLCLRFGPRRGYWNQPAAELRRVTPKTSVGLYVAAAIHVVAGIGFAIAFGSSGGIGMLVVLVATACFYVLCAQSFSLAHAVVRRRSEP